MKKNKKTYYLVDLENAGVAGLNSIKNHENSKVMLELGEFDPVGLSENRHA